MAVREVTVRADKEGFQSDKRNVVLERDESVTLSLKTRFDDKSLLEGVTSYYTKTAEERKATILPLELDRKIRDFASRFGVDLLAVSDKLGRLNTFFETPGALGVMFGGVGPSTLAASAKAMNVFSAKQLSSRFLSNPQGTVRWLQRQKPEVIEKIWSSLDKSPSGRILLTRLIDAMPVRAAKAAGVLPRLKGYGSAALALLGIGTFAAGLAVTIKTAPFFIPHVEKEFPEGVGLAAYKAYSNALNTKDSDDIRAALEVNQIWEKWLDKADELFTPLNKILPSINKVWLEKVSAERENIAFQRADLNRLLSNIGEVAVLPADESVTLLFDVTDERGVPLTASVWIDNEQQVNPSFKKFIVTAGEHIVWVKASRYLPADPVIFTAEGGSTKTISFSLKRAPPELPKELVDSSLITVTSLPEGARIFIDGKDMFVRTPHTFALNLGKHFIQLEKKGFQSAQRFIEVGEEEARTHAFSLSPFVEPEKPLEVPNAWQYTITVLDDDGVTPLTFRIIVDGVFTGKFSTDNIFLAPSSQFKLRLEKAGFKPIDETIVTEAL